MSVWKARGVIAALAFCITGSAFAASYTTTQTGAWNNTATWGGAGFPNSPGDDVTINHVVTLDSSRTVNNVTIASTLTQGANVLTINGVLVNDGTFDGAVVIGPNGGNVSSTTGTGYFAGTVTFSGPGTRTITGSQQLAFNDTVVVNGAVTNNCTATVFLYGLTSMTGTGSWTQGANSILRPEGTISVSTFDPSANGNTVIYNSQGTLTVRGGPGVTYYNLQAFGAANILGGDVTIANNLEIYSASLQDDGFQITGPGTSGTLLMQNPAELRIGQSSGARASNATLFPQFQSYSLGTTTKIVYYAAANQTIESSVPYANLEVRVATAGSFTKTVNGPIATVNDLMVEDTTGTVTLDGTFNAIGVGRDLIGDGTIDFGGGALSVGQHNTAFTGTVTPSYNITFNGIGAQSIRGTTYHNLIVNKTSGTATLAASATITNDLTVTSGTLSDGGFQIIGNGAGIISVAAGANLVLGANFPTVFVNYVLAAASGVTYSSATAQTVSGAPTYGNLTLHATGTHTKAIDTVSLTVASTLTLSASTGNTLTFDINGKIISISGNISKTDSGTVTMNMGASGGNLLIGGNFDNAVGFDPNTTGVVHYNGTGAQSVRSGNYRYLTINKTAGVATLSGTTTTSDNLEIPDGELNLGSNVLNADGTIAINGATGILQTASGTLNTKGNVSVIGTLTASGTSTVNVTGTNPAPTWSGGGTISLYNLGLSNANGMQVSGVDISVSNQLSLGGGPLTVQFGNVVTTALASRTSGYIDGDLQISIASGATRLFPLGANSVYLPADVRAAAGSGNVRMRAVNGSQPNATATNLLARHWTVVSGAPTQLDLTLIYNDSVITGLERSYVIGRYDGSLWSTPGGSINRTTNNAVITGQAAYLGDWTVGYASSLGQTAPSVVSFNPTSAGTGTSISIYGSNLTSPTAVTFFNAQNAGTFAGVDATEVTATVPAGASTGAVSVTTAAGTGSSSANGASFTVIAPASITSVANGNWSSSSTWSCACVPSSSDSVTIDGETVTIDSNISIASLTLSAGGINNPNLLTVTSSFAWTGGSVSGSGGALLLAAASTSTISGSSARSLDQYMSNQGTLTYSATGTLSQSVGVFNNFGTMTITSSGTWAQSGSGQFVNNSGATINRTTDAGTFTMGAVFTNDGSMALSSGTLAITGSFTNTGGVTLSSNAQLTSTGGGSHSGAFTIGSGSLVTYSGGTTTFSGTFSGAGAVRVNGGTLTTSGTPSGANLDFDAGTINGAGTLTISGSFDWTGGTLGLGGGALTATGAMTISGASSKTLSNFTLNNASTASSWSAGASNILLTSGGVFNNTGTLTIHNDSALTYDNAGPFPAFNNSGTLRKQTATGATVIGSGIPFPLNNTGGTLDIQTGVLQLNGAFNVTGAGGNLAAGTIDLYNGGTSSGAFSLASGAMVQFLAGTQTITGAWTGVAGSTYTINGGTVTVNTPGSLAGGTLSLSAGSLNGNATISASANFNWSGGTIGTGGGTLQIPSTATLTISGASAKTLTNFTIDNDSPTSSWTASASNILFTSGAVFQNDGTLTIQNNAAITYDNGGPFPAFNNTGTLRKQTGTGTTTFGQTVAFPFKNAGGTLDVQTGDVHLKGAFNVTGAGGNLSAGVLRLFGGGTSSGAFNVASGATLYFTGGTHGITGVWTGPAGSTYTINGATATINNPGSLAGGTINFDSGTLNGNATITPATSFNWTGGTIGTGGGTIQIPSTAALTISGASAKTLTNFAIDNESTTSTWAAGASNLLFTSGAVFQNDGTFTIHNDSALTYDNAGPFPAFNNTGTLRKQTATSTTVIGQGIAFAFNNAGGTLDIQTGVLQLNGAFNVTGAGGNLAAGTVNVYGNSTSSGSFTIAAGTKVAFLAGTQTMTGTWNAPGTFTINGATVTFTAGGLAAGALELFSGSLGGSQSLSADTFSWSGGQLGSGGGSLAVNVAGAMTVSGATAKTLSNFTLNHGSSNGLWSSGASNLLFTLGASLVNSGTFVIENNSAINYDNAGGFPSIVNTGTIRKQNSTGTSTIGSLNAFPVNNSGGILDVKSGALQVNGTLTHDAGSFVKFGIGGTTALTGHGQLIQPGSATFTGTIHAYTTGVFVPQGGHQFPVITYSSRSGTFAESLSFGAGRSFSLAYNAAAAVLTASGPTITTPLSPTSGTTAGGTTVVISGTGFQGSPGPFGGSVTFGGTTVTSATFDSTSQLTVVTPPHATGLVDVVITNPDAQPTTAANAFTFTQPSPSITTVTPSAGSTTGGTTVTIAGLDLDNASSVTFGGNAAVITGNTTNSITVTTPAGSAGTVNVVVTTPGGVATKTNGFSYAASPVSWISPVSGSWTDGSKWSTSVPPTAGQDVFIDVAGTYTVTFSGTDPNVATVQVGSGATLDVTAGTLTIGSASSVAAGGTLVLSGGTLAGAGAVNVNGSMNWTGGTLSKTVVISPGSAGTIAGNVTFGNVGSLTNNGTINYTSGSIAVGYNTSPTLNNTGTFNIVGDLPFANVGGCCVPGLTINNSGSFNKTSGTGVSTLQENTILNQTAGTISISSGKLSVAGGGSVSGGTITIAGGATFEVAGGTFSTSGTASVAGGGTFATSAGTANLGGSYATDETKLSAGTLNFTAAGTTNLLTVSGGTLGGGLGVTVIGPSVAHTWSNGTLSGKLTINGSNTLALNNMTFVSGGNLNNAGTINYAAGAISAAYNSPSTFNNSGTFNIVGDLSFSNISGCCVPGLTINNSGTFAKTSGTGVSTLSENIILNQTAGTISVATGKLSVLGGGSVTAGAISIPAGATFEIGSGTFSTSASASITGGGTFATSGGTSTLGGSYTAEETKLSGGTLSFTGAGTTNLLTVTGGTLSGATGVTVIGPSAAHTWTSGTLAGKLTINGGNTVTLNNMTFVSGGNLNNAGTINYTAGVISAAYNNPSTFNNSGTFNIAGDLSFNNFSGCCVPGLTINNSGTFAKTSGTGVSTLSENIILNQTAGTISVATGKLSVLGGGSVTAGAISIPAGATFEISSGTFSTSASASITGGGTFATSGGTATLGGSYTAQETKLSGGTLNFTGAGTTNLLTVTGGTLGGATGVTVVGPNAAHTWTSGTLAGKLTLSGSNTLALNNMTFVSGGDLNNAGTINYSAGVISAAYNNPSTFNNSGTFNIAGDLSFNNFSGCCVPGLTINNSGTFAKTTGTGVSTLSENIILNQSAGTITIGSGKLSVLGGGSVTGGTINIAGGATFETAGGTFSTSASAGITGGGTFATSGGTSTLAGSYATEETKLSGGTLSFTGAGTTNLLNVSGGTLSGAAGLTVQGPSAAHTWTNGNLGGKLTLIGGNTLALNNLTFVSGGYLSNVGTINFSAGAIGAAYNNPSTFDNIGTFNIQGDLPFLNSSGCCVLGLTINNTGNFNKTTGTGVSDIQGNITLNNNGTVSIMSGTLQLANAYTQAGGASLGIQLAGTGAGQFGRLTTAGVATLAGNLNVTYFGAYTPTDGDSFPILAFASRSGDFVTKNGLSYGSGTLNYTINATSVTLGATSSAAVSIVKTAPASVTLNQALSYTLTVTNAGPDPANTLSVSDTLPAGVTFVSTSAAGWSCSGTATVTCTRATLAAGSSVITINVTAPGAPTSLNNTATLTAANDSSPGDNSSNAVTTVSTASADLSLTTTAAPASIGVGGSTTYTITVANSGPNDATGVIVTDNLPPGQTATAATWPSGTCTGTTNISCAIGTITNGANVVVTIVATANTGGTWINTASVSSSVGDPNGANNSAGTTVVVTGASTLTVTSPNSSGNGTLAQAILDANAGNCTAPCNIHFNLSPLQAIVGPLPPATVAVKIDGTTQPGYAGVPLIEIDGTLANPGSVALTLNGGGSVVRGLSIHDFTGPGAAAIGVSPSVIGVQLLGNKMFNNVQGIDLGIDGPTPNDPGDTDNGSNNLQNFPAVSSAVFNAGSLTVTASVDSASTGSMRIEVFKASGSNEGQDLLGSVCRPTPLINDVFSMSTTSIAAGQSIVTTATSFNGAGCTTVANGTSEFSAPFAVTGCPGGSVTIAAATAVCPSSSGHTANIPSTPGGTYAWSITNGTITSATNTTSITFTAGASGTTTLNVTVTDAAGCVTNGSHNVTLTGSPTATITASPSVCASSTGNTASVPVQGGATYAWTITNGTINSASNIDTITFTAGATGTTTLNVTVSAGGCNSAGNHNATIAPAVVANVTAPPTACAGSAAHVATVNSTAGATYNWTVTNGIVTSGQGSTSITFSVGTAGTTVVSVQVTSGGCTANGSQTVTVNPIPSSAITAPGATCPNATGLSASVPTTAGATYAWTITNGTITSATNIAGITFTAGPSGTTTLNVTVTASGCASSATHNVTLTGSPTATITAPPSVCASSAGNTASVPFQGGATYAWTITNGTITSATNIDTITFTAGATGTTTLNVTVTAGGCNSAGTHNAAIAPAVVANVTAPPTACAGSAAHVATVNSTAGATYNWSVTNGTVTSGQGSTSITFSVGTAGTAVVSVQVTSGGCSTTGSQTVTVNPIPSSAITAPGATCPNATGLSASVPTTAGATYAWSITNGTITSATNIAGITFTAGPSGTTTLNVTVTASGCASSATHNVAITANPTATITGSATSCPGAPGNSASVPSQAGATYAWSITNGTITSATNGNGITFTAGATGITTVDVVVTANGCTTNGTHNVAITPPPNATITAPASVCASSTVNNASVATTAGATYGWTITNGTITSATNTNAITFTAGASGNVVLGVTVTANGCSNTGTRTVTTTTAPSATITAPTSTCPSAAGLAASVPTSVDATYAWTITNGTITSATNTNGITFTAGPSGTTTLNVTVTASGCASSATHNVTIGASPTATITAPANVCANATGNTASVAAQAGATYTWTIGNGTITAGQGTTAITFTAGATGSVTLGVTVAAAGCNATGNSTVPIVGGLSPTIGGPNAVCANTPFTLDAGPGFATYAWSNGATSQTINVFQSATTTYTVTVTNGGCSAQASKTVTVSASPAAFIGAPGLLQPNSTGNNASVTAQAGATYAWTVANGTLTAGQGTSTITFSAPASGSVEISVTVTIGACSASNTASIPVQPAASEADLTVTKSAPATVNAGQTFTYTIEVINNGPANAENISITDELPAGLTLVGVNTGWPCTTTATSVRCSGQTAIVGPNSPISITVRAPSQSVTLTNTVSITSLTTDPNTGNNSASATTQILASPTCATAPPSLLEPANAATNLTSPVTFSWTAVTGATVYELWLSDALLGTTSTTSLTFPVPSGAGSWYVVARLGGGCDPLVSSRRTFTVPAGSNCSTHGTPQITAPPANATVTSPVTIAWTAVPQAIGYRVLMSVGGGAAQDLGATDGAISLTANVPPGNITVFVEALFSGCPPTRSNGATFTVTAPDPCAGRGAVGLVSPTSNAVVNASSVEFRWSSVANADQYRLWASINGGAAQILGTTRETSLRVLVGRGEVFWWIETLFDGCASTESARFRFTIPQAEVCANTRPDLIAPAHNATVTSASVTFNWSAIDNAIGYELWLTLEDGAPTLFGTTATTSLTREVPAGDLEWFVRVRVDRCDPRDSQKSKFTYAPPANCAPNERPMADAPSEDAEVASPVSFRWSAPAGATRYELYVIRGNSAAALAGSATTAALDNISLASGNIRWFVRAFFGANCPPLDSVDQSLTIVATPQACSSLDAPTVTAPGQISSGVPFRIRWSPIPGATSYQLQIADNADFTNAESITTSGTEHEVVRTNAGATPIAVHARVRAIDTRCSPAPALSLFGPTAAIFVLPVTSNDGSLPASSHGTVTFTIPLGPELAGQTFTAVPTQPWLSVTPASGVVGPTGTILTVTANTAGLPLGASLGGITITTTTPAANGIRGNGTSTTTKPVTISLVTPVAPANRNTPPPDALIIPAVANADGINAHFQSDVRVTNASASPVKYQLTFTPSGEGLTASKQTTMSIDPGRTIALDDVLKSWFGTGSVSSTGTLEVRPLTQTSTTAVPSSVVKGLANLSSFASSRTFNATATGTYGQYIPAIPFASFVGKPAAGAASILSLQQIAQSSQYRTNLGLLEATGESASLMVSVFGPGGAKLTSFPVELKGGQHTQLNSFLTQHGVTSLNDGRIEVQVTSGNGKVTAYASVLDNSTSDPLLVTPVSLSDDGNNKWVVPGVADLNNGLANWQTDLRVFNASTAAVDATLSFYSQNGGEPKTKNVTIQAGQVLELDKTLASVFNATNDGGAVHITTPLASRLIATARTYNQTSTGTYGQFISAVTPIEAAAVGTRALQILQVEESTRYRSNIGLAEVSGKPVTLEVSIITGDAKTSAFLEVNLGANEFRQLGGLLRNLGAEVHNARVTVRATSGEGRVAAYASVIDMLTQDPTYVPAQ